MNYELTKRLKDAGFPQNEPGHFEFGCKLPEIEMRLTHSFGSSCDCLVKFPTLSELIEACKKLVGKVEGINTFLIMNDLREDEWLASMQLINIKAIGMKKGEGMPSVKFSYIAQTPEIAVANLWLKLNGK